MNPRIRLVIAGVVVVALAATAAYFILRGGPRGDGLVASGTVEATEAQLGFEVSGRIAAVVVREGDTVTQGQALAQLDTTEAATRRAQSQAQARAARARLLELERGPRRSTRPVRRPAPPTSGAPKPSATSTGPSS